MFRNGAFKGVDVKKHEQEQRKEGDKDPGRRAPQCIRVKLTSGFCFSSFLSLFFFFFQSLWLWKEKKIRVPAELETDVAVSPLFDFSALCRVIIAGDDENGPSPAKSRLTVSFYTLPSLCGGGGVPPLPFFSSHSLSFCLECDLHEQPHDPTWVSVQAASFLYIERMKRRWAEPRKGQLPSLFRILISFLSLFFPPSPTPAVERRRRNHKAKFTVRDSECLIHQTGWGAPSDLMHATD